VGENLAQKDSSAMLQAPQTIRYYQKLTDALVDLWHQGYRFEDLRLYLDGYLACLMHSNILEPYQIHRLEEDAFRFLRDPSNFEAPVPEPKPGYY
jgi:hypothetical protein